MGHEHDFTLLDRQQAKANQLGIPLAQYRENLAAGLKWCSGCKVWHDRGLFGLNSSRSDGLQPQCREWRIRAQLRARKGGGDR